MKKILFLLITSSLMINSMEEKEFYLDDQHTDWATVSTNFIKQQESKKASSRELENLSHSTALWKLLDGDGIPDLKFMAAVVLLVDFINTYLAIKNKNIPEELIEFLLRLRIKFGKKLVDLMSKGSAEQARSLVNAGAYLDQKYQPLTSSPEDLACKDWTPLMFACANGWVTTVALLLEKGADFNCQDAYGNSALAIAVREPSSHGLAKRLVELLLKAGADVNLQNSTGATALHWAVLVDNEQVVNMLVNTNYDVTLTNRCIGTALEFARKQGKQRIISLIESIQKNRD